MHTLDTTENKYTRRVAVYEREKPQYIMLICGVICPFARPLALPLSLCHPILASGSMGNISLQSAIK